MRGNLLIALGCMLCVVACGGSGSSLGSLGGGSGGGKVSNVQSVVIDAGPTIIANSSTPAINTLYTTVTICVPGSTTQCQTIDHIQVDTGSNGFRILASSGFSLTLPTVTDSAGNALAECVGFVDGSSYGPVRKADLKIAGETASNIEIQVIGDGAYQFPQDGTCLKPEENTVTQFGANGILGVGPFVSDCGPSCNSYYTCPTPTTCSQSTTVTEAMQVSNPVASFATDNNGVIIQLPSVAAAGAATATGSLIFGIGTQSNNALGSAKILPVSAANGSFTTLYKIGTLSDSFIDSGSNGLFFPDPTIASSSPCADNSSFYCPTSPLSESAVMKGSDGTTSLSVNFTVVGEQTYLHGSAAAPGLAGQISSSNKSADVNQIFDWGLSFYYGRNVYTAIDGKTTTGTTVVGPYFAF